MTGPRPHREVAGAELVPPNGCVASSELYYLSELLLPPLLW